MAETSFVKWAAKAVAALVTPLVFTALAWVSAKVLPFEYDPAVVEKVVLAVATAVVVFAVRNKDRFYDAREALKERLRK